MRRHLFRVGIASAVLYLPVALGAFILFSAPAWPSEAAPKGDLAAVDPSPKKPTACKTPLDTFMAGVEHRQLTGRQAQQYIAASGATVHPGTDTVAYKVMGSKVAVMLAKQGCVVGFSVVDDKLHRTVMRKAFGFAV